jgi:methylated-DNA-protein-cysteine methyltransferase-like protein
MASDFFNAVYIQVRKIPKGKVATYGQIAALVRKPRASQMVGWALHALNSAKDTSVPWQRVINRHGDISTTCLEHTADEQAFLLKSEGVVVENKEGAWHVDLARFLWKSRR